MLKLKSFLLVLAVSLSAAAQQSDNDRCVQGQCNGYLAPQGPCTTPLLFVEYDQNPTPLWACVNRVWTPAGGGGSAPTVTINSFTTPTPNVERGAKLTNPTFSSSYTGTPTSAAITNTDGTSSPTALASPYTSGAVTGSFPATAGVCTTFTLTTVPSATRTLQICDPPRVFGGVGTSGTTGATASGTTAILTGATGTLASAGLVSTSVNQTFGPYAPSAQYLHLLIVGNGHTIFRDPSTGFAIPFNAPTCFTFTNVNSAAVAMCDYQSTNAITASAQSVLVVN